jgi:hypothetical protein
MSTKYRVAIFDKDGAFDSETWFTDKEKALHSAAGCLNVP